MALPSALFSFLSLFLYLSSHANITQNLPISLDLNSSHFQTSRSFEKLVIKMPIQKWVVSIKGEQTQLITVIHSTFTIHSTSEGIFTGLCKIVISECQQLVDFWEDNIVLKLQRIRIWILLTCFIT